MAREQRGRRRKGTASDEIITMNHVSKAYATGAPALNGVDLHIKKGEFVFIVEDSVNKVGVDLNTASASLLEYISGTAQSKRS